MQQLHLVNCVPVSLNMCVRVLKLMPVCLSSDACAFVCIIWLRNCCQACPAVVPCLSGHRPAFTHRETGRQATAGSERGLMYMKVD